LAGATGLVAVGGALGFALLRINALEHSVAELNEQVRLAEAKKERLQRDLDALQAGASDPENEMAPPPKPARSQRIPSNRELLDGLKDWAERAWALEDFANLNPHFATPEMTLLDELDWFTVTNGIELQSEADLRRALARLRTMAKHKLGRRISTALRAFAHSVATGNPEHDIATFAASIEDPILVEALKRFELSTVDSGEPGKPPTLVLSERDSVDGLWGTRISFGSDGSVSETFVFSPSKSMENAIETFQKDHGRPPRDCDEVLPYYNADAGKTRRRELTRSELEDLYHAVGNRI